MPTYEIQPQGSYLRIEVLEPPQGTIILPEQAKERPNLARILAVGPGLLSVNGDYIKHDFEIGDIILIKRYSPEIYELPDKSDITFVSMAEVIAKIIPIDEEEEDADG